MQSAIVTPERPRQTTSKLAYDHEKQGRYNRNNLPDGSDVYFFKSQHVFSEELAQLLCRQRSSSKVQPECPEIVCTALSQQAIGEC